MVVVMEQNLRNRRPEVAEVLIRVAAATSFERNFQAYDQLDSLLKLRPGWDGYSGHAPSEEAVHQAKAFLANLPIDLAMPAIEPSGDGEINFVWRSDAAYLEIGFCGDHHFSFFGKTKTLPEKREFGDIPVTANRLPLSLQWLLNHFPDVVPVRKNIAERESFAWAS
ncbi:hypothetical protein J2X45_002873 [Caulobacter sp. BE264]|uniref:hypothetical protein n=1 Tax=Caulobacter sp. BE264 TaxID=2817724 RepID=UPI00285DE65E|nr:hypothetical protein [Caulobacter sp. BE264]MDR7231773.1 hypothetical protein [Caulobacter sp. BE264]